MKKFLILLVLSAVAARAQTTNFWIGPTNVAAIGSWTNAANWSPDVPDTVTEIASFVADFTVNAALTLDGTQTVNGVLFNDTVGGTRQTLTINPGSPAGVLLFGGASPFFNVVSGSEGQPTTISSPTDYSTFTKLGNGWLQLTSLTSNELPASVAPAAGALLLNQVNSNLVVGAGGFVKAGAGQFVTSSTMPLTGAGTITVNAGRMEVRRGSTNFSGNIVVNSNGQYVARQSYTDQFGDTNGVTIVNGGGQARFQDPATFTNSEAWFLNGFRADGSLLADYADATLNGAITISTNTHIGINTYNHAIRHTRLNGVIDDGAATAGVTFTIIYGGANVGADQQYTNFRTASRFIISSSNTYGGATYIAARTGSTNVPNQVLTVELTNGHNRLPVTTVLTLGGVPPGITGNNSMCGRLLLDGVNQQLAGLASLGTGLFNRVSSTTPDLCTLTINGTTTNAFNGTIGGDLADESNIEIIKRGNGWQVFGGANTYTGWTTVAGGVLEASNSFALGTAAAGTSVSNAAQLRLSGGITTDEQLILVGSGPSGSNLGALRTVIGTNTVNGPVTFTGGVGGRIQTAGTLILNGGLTATNLNVMIATFAGATSIINTNPVNIGSGILQLHDPGTTYINTSVNVMSQLNPAWGNTTWLGPSDVLPVEVAIIIGQFANSSTAGSGVLDLNGSQVNCAHFASAHSNGVAQPHNIILRNTHPDPVTFVVNQTNTSTFNGRILGNLTLVKDGAGSLTLTGTNTFANDLEIYGGTLALADGGSLACTNIVVKGLGTLLVTGRYDQTLTVLPGQILTGPGTVIGTITNTGRIAPGNSPGILTNIGTLVQQTNGTLALELGGTDPTNHDAIATTTLQLGGTLELSLINAYTPAHGDNFIIATATGIITGDFAATNAPTLSPGLRWQLDNYGSALLLSVVSNAAPPPTGYNAFSNTFALVNGPEGDDDTDGYANLLEYVTGANPTNTDTIARIQAARTNALFALRFTRNTNSTDATLIVEGAYSPSNNTDWIGFATNINGSWGSATNVIEDSGNPASVTAYDPAPAATNRFLRLRVTRP